MDNEGRCGTCGFLSQRVALLGGWRAHSGFHEVEVGEREEPHANFPIVPGDTNALQRGEFACFRLKADLPAEIAETAKRRQVSDDVAAHEIVWKDRSCASWCAYEPGISPSGHLMELKATRLEQDRQAFERTMRDLGVEQQARERRADRRLTKAAIIIGLLVGLFQLAAAILAMTKDTIGCELFKSVCGALLK